MEDDVLVEELSGLGALDPPLVVADEAALVEARPLGAEEGAAPAARRAQVVHLAERSQVRSFQSVNHFKVDLLLGPLQTSRTSSYSK